MKSEQWDKEDQIIADMVLANPYLMALFRVKELCNKNKINLNETGLHAELSKLGVRNPNAVHVKLKEMGKL